MKTLHFTIFLTLLFKIYCDPVTEWTDPQSGTKYDFSSLKRDPE
jgi:hypothetical protein